MYNVLNFHLRNFSIVHKQAVRIMYQSFNATEPTEYIFSPYILKEFRNRWFLFGCKVSDHRLYNLALDRIASVEPHDTPYYENPDFDSERFFDDVIGVSKNLHDTPRRVKFWANAEQSKYIKTKPLHPSQKLKSENPEDGSCVFQIEVCINFEMYSVFMSYGPGLKIIYPHFAVSYMKVKLREAADLYDTKI